MQTRGWTVVSSGRDRYGEFACTVRAENRTGFCGFSRPGRSESRERAERGPVDWCPRTRGWPSPGMGRPPSGRMEIGSDQRGEVNDRMGGAQRGREIAQEAVEYGVGGEEGQPQNQHRVGMMMKYVPGIPVADQFVESLVFNVPTVVAELEDGSRPGQGGGHGGGKGAGRRVT